MSAYISVLIPKFSVEQFLGCKMRYHVFCRKTKFNSFGQIVHWEAAFRRLSVSRCLIFNRLSKVFGDVKKINFVAEQKDFQMLKWFLIE